MKKENYWNCWICKSKGRTIHSLFKKIKVTSQKYAELNLIIQPGTFIKNETTDVIIELPKEFISLSSTTLSKIETIESRHALKYLEKRNITSEDIIKYNIGFCTEGKYSGRVIIPSYDEDAYLNYFIARDYTGNLSRKYDNPPIPLKNIIGFELYINWNLPIVLVEGMFDALTIKRNVIPLFGKIIQEKLMKRIVSSEVKKIYICLDADALKDAIKVAEYLMSQGKEVYLIELEGKDVSEVGFESFLNTLEKVVPLNFQLLLEIKLKHI